MAERASENSDCVSPDEETSGAPSIFPVTPRRGYDRRRRERRYFETRVRFLTPDGVEHLGALKDISPIGLGIATDQRPALEARVIVYIDRIGRFEGLVVRHDEEGFGVQMLLSDTKLDRLEKAIERFFLNEYPDAESSDRRVGVNDRRSSGRCSIDLDEIFGVRMDGERFKCSILNISLTGIEVSTPAHLDLGEEVRIGAVRGIVVRSTGRGYAINRADIEL